MRKFIYGFTVALILSVAGLVAASPQTQPLDMQNFQINNLAAGTASTDAVNLSQIPSSSSPLSPTSGGTGQSTVNQGDLLYGSATDVWSRLAKNASATRYLSNTGSSNNPAWAQVDLTNGVTGVLPAANGGSTVSSSFYWCGTSGGTGSAFTLTCPAAVTSYATGLVIAFHAGQSNSSGTVTLNINSIGTANFAALDNVGAPYGTMVGGEIGSAGTFFAIYDLSSFVIINAIHTSSTGTYTPTLFNTTNVAASTAHGGRWIRLGNIITGGVAVDIDPTSASVSTVLGVSLPVASNFTGAFQASGTCNADDSVSLSAAIYADPTNDRMQVTYLNTAQTANKGFQCVFTYEVN